MSEIEVRPITEGDIPGLSEGMSPGVSMSQIQHRYEECQLGYREMLVALLDGRPVGSVSIGGKKRDRFSGALRLFALDVGIRYQNRGAGTALIAAVEEDARRRGLNLVNLEVGETNDGARRLYERLGFVLCGEAEWDSWTAYREDGTTFEEGEMCVPMVKELD